jgi:hypothetical protein
MPILTYIKLGAVAIGVAVILFLGVNYKRMQHQISVYKVQVEQLEAANKYYEKQAGIDKQTQEVKNEIDQAVQSGDINRIRELYERLHQHQTSGKGKTPN